MTRAAFLLLFIIGVSSCKKYLDPKYAYTQPVLDLKAEGKTLEADSAIAFIDSMHIDTSKAFYYFTNIKSFKENEPLVNIRLQGKSLGNYDIGSNTSLSFQKPENHQVYSAQSGKIVIYEWNMSTKKISGNFYATLLDSTGNKIQIESGRFNAVKYR
jgi:hypothetical protein